MTDRILITGATGFIGGALIRHLAEQDQHVIAVTRPDSGPLDLGCPNIIWNGDVDRLVSDVNEAQPDVIYHLATNFIAHHEPGDIPELIAANVTFGTAILEAAQATRARVVITGSAWQHFEGNSYQPVSLYAATKQALLDMAIFYAQAGVDIRELTLFDTYGPNDPRGKLLSQLLVAAGSQRPLEMTSGKQMINLLFIVDVVRGLIQAADLEEGAAGEVDRYVLRAEESISIRNLVEVTENVIGRSIPVMWAKKEDREKEMLVEWEFGRTLPKWHPSVHLTEGIARCWAEFDSKA